MTRSRLPLVLGIVLILLAGVGGGAWWYLFGANKVAAADLVPTDTVAFATIPNGVAIAMGYQTSHLKTLVDSPNSKPLIDAITTLVGQKTLDVLAAFGPNLSGQSFIAVTHYDPDQPAQIGFVAAMKPKAGMADFNAFLDKLKASWPDVLKQGTTGTGNVAGVDYQWIKGPNAPDKVCVAQVGGWIVTAWGEASLQDWIERYQKKSATPNLAQNADYQKSLTRVGKDPMALLYVNYHAVLGLIQKTVEKTNPGAGDYLSKKLVSVGGAAVATSFEDGDIVDRFSVLISQQAMLDSGFGATPCPFDTIKFAGPDTCLYWASSVNVQQYWKNLQEQLVKMPGNAAAGSVSANLQNAAQSVGLDFQHNIVDPLGSEVSLQAEWPANSTYPEIGLLVKLDKPDDFQPTIQAVIDVVRKTYAASAVIVELESNGQKFAALKFLQSSLISPTITENGPYFGIFLTEGMAVRSFQRDASIGLLHNADFNRQVGDKRTGASQVLFLDSPHLLDHAYRTAMPYINILSMFNKQLAGLLRDKTMPADLTWLAPMDTWSLVATPDADGITGYSISGIGNQGIFLATSLGGAAGLAQSMGFHPAWMPNGMFNQKPSLPGIPAMPANTPPPATNPPPTTAPVVAPTTPDLSTNAPPAPAATSPTGAAPSTPGASMNSAPVPAPASPPSTNAPSPQ